jgi:hypothetical protein
MTGANTDSVRTDECEIAVAMMMKLAQRLFYAHVSNGDSSGIDNGDATFAAWRELRSVAETILAVRSTCLDTPHYEWMTAALHIAHSSYHETVLTSGNEHHVSICDCIVARDVRDLLQIIGEDEEAA